MRLVIGNKNYSSWSMRPWVLMRQADIEFEEISLRFDGFDAGSRFKTEVGRLSPAGRVPILIDDDLVIWDTLAIAEYLAERFPDMRLWPAETAARARARSVCAEMHAGFGALRAHFGMNIEASLPEVGERLLRERADVQGDWGRIVAMWSELLIEQGGPFLFGDFSIADAYYAPVAMRIRTYRLPCPPAIGAYVDRIAGLPSVAAWIQGALIEQDFLAFEEPYRTHR